MIIKILAPGCTLSGSGSVGDALVLVALNDPFPESPLVALAITAAAAALAAEATPTAVRSPGTPPAGFGAVESGSSSI